MNLLFVILFFNLIGSVISLLGGFLLFLNEGLSRKVSPYLAPFAAGVLIGTAFLDLLPEAVELSEPIGGVEAVFSLVLFGVLAFFFLERVLHWIHHHDYEKHLDKNKPVVFLIIVGDAIHNFIDGVIIATTFLVNIPLGIVTTIAVGAHEIPQEIGDFGVLIKHGYSRKKAMLINILSSLASFAGAILAFYLGQVTQNMTVIFLSIASGLFLYIALSDLIPEIHRENKSKFALGQSLSLLLGILTIYMVLEVIHHILPA